MEALPGREAADHFEKKGTTPKEDKQAYVQNLFLGLRAKAGCGDEFLLPSSKKKMTEPKES